MAKTKEKVSKETYCQCEMVSIDEDGKAWTHVAWIPSKFAHIGKHVLIDDKPGRWKVTAAGEKRPAYIVEAYALNARKAFDGMPSIKRGNK